MDNVIPFEPRPKTTEHITDADYMPLPELEQLVDSASEAFAAVFGATSNNPDDSVLSCLVCGHGEFRLHANGKVTCATEGCGTEILAQWYLTNAPDAL